MSLSVTFKETYLFLRKNIDMMVISTAITYPKLNPLSLLFSKVLNN